MPRAQRREQILEAATRAFARGGFAKTGLDAIAAEAAVTQVILYRHFASKADLYREVLEHANNRLREATGADDFDDSTIPALVRAAAADPDAFRLLFRYAAREPEFRDMADSLVEGSTELASRHLAGIADDRWRNWAARLLPTMTIDAVIAWLDAGQPDPDQAATRIRSIVDATIAAASAQ
ncbi:TetR family transcriptional regulator [Mycobacterium sp. 852002-50816_SCH5313054-b]|uniref:TetR/AcrR family transcriptional regulator n=1 Tax=Mycobacterium sp. 852002-50816_SCH5313054-b TaxID=1834092 RepID=UPI0007FD3852|nr:TetR/AcrR family transcriptional regulator [Mycobacterium sp. 852002-50816_SCH5313054-b]OBF60218.1 TetR family transcriptional regulator [Mycobacterium sp. 852002-50816_SCH5313054-b]